MLCAILRVTEKTATGLGRWKSINHLGKADRFANMPTIGFLDSLRWTLMILISQLIGALVASGLTFLLIAFGIPLLISLRFGG